MQVNLETLEEARALVAHAIIRHRKKFAPVLERFDKEVEAARKKIPSRRPSASCKLYARRRFKRDPDHPPVKVLNRWAFAVFFTELFMAHEPCDYLIGRIERR